MDLVRRFLFEHRPVRGHWVNLTHAWRELRAHTHYPPAVEQLLGEAVAASVLLAATLKFRGRLTFQLQGDGAVSLLVAQCSHDFRLRAVARFNADAVRALGEGMHEAQRFAVLAGHHGRVAVTIEAEASSRPYQGVVPLSGTSLAQSLEAYFGSSEQLPTRVRLASDAHRAAGMLVQKLPEESPADPDVAAAWRGAQLGIAQLGKSELLEGSVERLLAHGFAGYDLRLFRGAPIRFECRCSHGRVAGLLRALGPQEVREVLKEQGAVIVTCEFCQRPYRFDPADVEALFADESLSDGSAAIH
jgi:molecular chaperone Hsp33